MTTAHHDQRPRLGAEVLERRDVPAGFVLSAALPGAPALVRVLDGTTGAVVRQIDAFPGYLGGLYADASADRNGDALPDRIVVGTRGGTTPHVKVFDGTSGAVLQSFFAYDAGFLGGVDVALGDVNGDNIEDMITGAAAGTSPHVKVFDGITGAELHSFLAFDAGFLGGVSVGAGDINNDGADDILVGAAVGAAPHVKAFDGRTGALLQSFLAFDGQFVGGVRVAGGDLDGDGQIDIIVGAGPGAGSHVKVFRGSDLTLLGSRIVFEHKYRGGVEVGVSDATGNGRVDLIVERASGGTRFRVFDDNGLDGPFRDLFDDNGYGAVPVAPPGSAPQQTLTAGEVDALLRRAAAASSTSDAIIAIVDRNGRILGVRVEGGVAPEITGDVGTFVFAVDGAVSKARTGAFFGNNQAPLTSRTVQFISQSTITQREVNSNPNITDPNSTLRGPGFVAPVGIKGHFPPNVPFTPQVDLFQIEHTNRDGTFHVGGDRIKGTADDVPLDQRFNIDPAFVPAGNSLFPPDSFGFETGLLPGAQNRGIATLPGGIPIFKNGQVVGGIGVFFPGRTGFATEENSRLSTTFNPLLPDRSLEAEWIAFAAAGGTRVAIGSVPLAPVDSLNGVGLPAGFGLPAGRIDLVGIQLDVFGPGGSVEGSRVLLEVGNTVGRGSPADGGNVLVSGGANGVPGGGDDIFLRDGLPVPEGWLVTPHDGVGITAAEAEAIITAGLIQSAEVRAAIRLPIDTRAKFVYAVADRNGEIVALFRQPDATVFSIDVAVAKARNVAYYADPAQLQPIDQLPGVAAGFAFTNRTFRFLGEPRYPEGIDGAPPGFFSQLNDDPLGTNRFTGLLQGAPLPASAYQSVVGFDAFNPGTNFRQPGNILNQNGIVFFPGSSPLYRPNGPAFALIGGFGVSGDGVDQDDVTTVGGQSGFGAPLEIRADQIIFRGVRLPYQKFNRNPEG